MFELDWNYNLDFYKECRLNITHVKLLHDNQKAQFLTITSFS